MIAYLERKRATCQPKTVSAIATRLTHFGVFLADVDPGLRSIAALERRRHIEPYLTSLVDAVNPKNGELITVADRSRRVLALTGFLTDITEWGWPDHPAGWCSATTTPSFRRRCPATCRSTSTVA